MHSQSCLIAPSGNGGPREDKPELRAGASGFSAPRSSICLDHSPCRRRAANIRIKCIFIVQLQQYCATIRMRCRPLAAEFCTRAAIRNLGGQFAADQTVEDAAPSIAALPAHGLSTFAAGYDQHTQHTSARIIFLFSTRDSRLHPAH